MHETYTLLYDKDGVEVGTLVLFVRTGVQRIALDPQPYETLAAGGYRIPPPPWPLFDADRQQLTT